MSAFLKLKTAQAVSLLQYSYGELLQLSNVCLALEMNCNGFVFFNIELIGERGRAYCFLCKQNN